MKKVLLFLLVIFFAIICGLVLVLYNIKGNEAEIKKFNQEYEIYLNKEIYGAEVATVINKAVDNNSKYEVQKDANGFYIDDGLHSIKIELKMITVDKTYNMETIYNFGMNEFVKNFNLINFKCTNIEYHKATGKVSKLIFEQLEY